MKSRLLVISSILFILVMATCERSHGGAMKDINWIRTYDEGLKKANETDKYLFVLITAPSWCYYCKVFERKVLENKEIQDILNSDYVPVLVLDRTNGVRNPDLERFVFPGFPSVYIYNKSGNKVKNISTPNVNKMINVLKEYASGPKKEKEVEKGVGTSSKHITDLKVIHNGKGLTSEDEEALDSFMDDWVKK